MLEYADVIWDSLPNLMAEKIENIQKEAARIVTGESKLVSCDLLYKDTCWEILSERREKHKIIQFHKMVHDKTPRFLSQMVPRRHFEITNIRTRQSDNISGIRTKSHYKNSSYYYSLVERYSIQHK